MTQAELFNPSRWPYKPYCSDALEFGVSPRPLKTALTKPYIQANPPYLRVWSIHDLDRPGAATAWEDYLLPPPSWAAVNKKNGHAHLVYGLSAPVLLEAEDARQAPLRYLVATEHAFREKLQADPGYSGLITKNPKHPTWHTLYGPRPFYDLGELAEYVDLPKHLPKRKPEQIGLGRNVTLFDYLRQWAYRNIKRFKQDIRNFVVWQAECYDKALSRNGDFLYPLDPSETNHIARSVAKWTWNRFDLEASNAQFSQKQAKRGKSNTSEQQASKGKAGGKASGLSRLSASEDKRASARLMAAKGMTQSAIAEALQVAQKTISNWLRHSQQPD